jgi:exopolyphosphatase/guanosine-5'-triphosphate,3'-diphosphate pyrophosphatase
VNEKTETGSRKPETGNTGISMPVLAAIDVGTNTVRLLVAESAGPGHCRALYEDQAITRLGEGFGAARTLGREPMQRTLGVVVRYADVARAFGAQHISAVGTAAARDARNRPEFVAEVERAAGLRLEILSGEREAALMLRGVLAGLGLGRERVLVVDVGGGSTEFVMAAGGAPERLVSLRLGVVPLTERYLKCNPPRTWELIKLEGAIADGLVGLQERLGEVRGRLCAGTGGTATTLAAIDMGLREYDARRVNGYRLYRRRLTELYRWLSRMTLESRRRVPGLEPDRADVIVAGAAIVLQAMEALGFSEVKVSDGGLREGVLLELLEAVVGPPPAPAVPVPAAAPAGASGEAEAPGDVPGPSDTAPPPSEDPAGPAPAVPLGGESGEPLSE